MCMLTCSFHQGLDFYVAGCAPTIIDVTNVRCCWWCGLGWSQALPAAARASCCHVIFLSVLQTLPLQASFAYVRNARNNHMPLPAMTYSQLYGGKGSLICSAQQADAASLDCGPLWSSLPFCTGWNAEPHGNELAIQIASVFLSGAKGPTLFQSVQHDFNKER